ncbi:hypothetical protein ACWGJW_24435, partial [Streptomyces nigrescens]
MEPGGVQPAAERLADHREVVGVHPGLGQLGGPDPAVGLVRAGQYDIQCERADDEVLLMVVDPAALVVAQEAGRAGVRDDRAE